MIFGDALSDHLVYLFIISRFILKFACVLPLHCMSPSVWILVYKGVYIFNYVPAILEDKGRIFLFDYFSLVNCHPVII